MSVNTIAGAGVNGLTPNSRIEDDGAKVRHHNNHARHMHRDHGCGRSNFEERLELYQKLEELQQASPEQLKEVLTSVAQSLDALAAEGGRGAHRLMRVAARFERAAISGDLNDLRPGWLQRGATEMKPPLADFESFIRPTFAPGAGDAPRAPIPAFGLGGLGLVRGASDLIQAALAEVNQALAGVELTAEEQALEDAADAAALADETLESAPVEDVNGMALALNSATNVDEAALQEALRQAEALNEESP